MAWAPVTLQPGLNTELTEADNRGAYTSTDLGRFKAGRFQKLGGWSRYYNGSVTGVPVGAHAWQDLTGADRLAVATTTHLYDLTGGALRNVSPQTYLSNNSAVFTTTTGSNIVTIADTGVTTITNYDSIYLNAPVAIGGLVLSGMYQVTQYVSAGIYRIQAGGNATSNASGGDTPRLTFTAGSANISVHLPVHKLSAGGSIVFPNPIVAAGLTISGKYTVQSVTGPDDFVISAANSASSTPGVGISETYSTLYYIAIGPIAVGGTYGSGTYGSGIYGTGSPTIADTGNDIAAPDWSLDNWGELLVGTPDGGGIYYWGPNSGYQNASIISTAPIFNTGSFIANAQQMIVAYGSTDHADVGVYQDPLMVRWCDSEDFTTWQATAANQAGSRRLPTGSRCVGGAATPHRSLIWTDTSVWSMDYIGASLVFGFTELASGCGLIAKHAHAQVGDVVYWMSNSNFYSLSGGAVTPMECPVWDSVFQNLNHDGAQLCHAGVNSDFNEVWFFYPSVTTGYSLMTDELTDDMVDEFGVYMSDGTVAGNNCDRYVKYNVLTGLWDIGGMQRNVWIDRSVIGSPTAVDNNGIIYSHETGYDADGHPLIPSFDTAWIYIGEGEDITFIDRIYPDFKWGEYGGAADANISITVQVVKNLGDTPKTYGPFTVTRAQPFISKRMRGRYIKLTVSSSDMGSFWRLGHLRVRFTKDGRG
jgi:hypothetical protein